MLRPPPLPIGTALLALVVAACTSGTPHPPELGNCVPLQEASCSNPARAGGSGNGGSGGQDSGADSTIEPSDASSCSTVVMAPTPACTSCVALNCCPQSTACAGANDTACYGAVTCVFGCASGGSTCGSLCSVSALPNTSAANYNALAQCILSSCASQQCPALAQAPVGDP